MSDSLWPHGPQHARLPCLSRSLDKFSEVYSSKLSEVCSNSCPLSQWCCNHLILCHSLFLLLSFFPSIRVFSSESTFCIRWPKHWSFSFSISPCNEHLKNFQFPLGLSSTHIPCINFLLLLWQITTNFSDLKQQKSVILQFSRPEVNILLPGLKSKPCSKAGSLWRLE